MKLSDVVARLDSLDREATIYAAQPWTSESSAVVETEPSSGGLPEAAAQCGMAYFLEVFVAHDFVEDWEASLDKSPSAAERCERLIRYAVDDA
ncbi:MAG TPA: hypothetical protein VHE81_20570 [Lacipirellulaceae bacterium]|nr:hypothetical protein [Lacipirellulaceae bacterium]